MEADPKLLRLVRNYAFLSALATAAGRHQIAHECADRMMRAWALIEPSKDEALVGDDGGLHGDGGGW